MVGAAGLEPATLCLEGRCSIHLSYAPLLISLYRGSRPRQLPAQVRGPFEIEPNAHELNLRRTASAAVTPRYCASSKMEKPLRSELANRIRPSGLRNCRRSVE